MTLADKFFEALGQELQELRQTQMGAIDQAADAIVESVAKGGILHIHDTGHMLITEAIGRACGLMMVAPFSFSLNLNDPARKRPGKSAPSYEDVAGYVRYALASSTIQSGDVLIIGSVSGRATQPIELALQAKAMGVKVIGMTSVAHSSNAICEHPGGKRLFEVADLVIDYRGPVGDAAVEVQGLDVKICPTSGLVAATVNWALTAQVVEKMMARGMTPSVWKSINVPDGAECNARVRKQFEEQGY